MTVYYNALDDNYYNEIDPFAAAWLRNLIAKKLIAAGTVDERSIKDVQPDDLRGFKQCHFFAGIGVWSYALRRAGWPDERPVWTGSCPCQPFSSAGKGGGFADERHLWPDFFRLIKECRPDDVLGEQVAGTDGLMWLDLVSSDMESEDYAFGAVDTCAAGFGSPNIRQRLNWYAQRLAKPDNNRRRAGAFAGIHDAQHHIEPRRGAFGLADADGQRLQGLGELGTGGGAAGREPPRCAASGGSGAEPGGLADAHGGNARAERQQRSGEQRQQPEDGGAGGVVDTVRGGTGPDAGYGDRAEEGAFGEDWNSPGPVASTWDDDAPGGMADADGERQHRGAGLCSGRPSGHGRIFIGDDSGIYGKRPGPTNGIWRAADWLFCRDGKWRPVEPGTFPLVDGTPRELAKLRTGSLRGYGNALNAEAATEFIGVVMDAKEAEAAAW